MPANMETSIVATGLEMVSFHSSIKEGQCQRMLKLLDNALVSHASKVMLKILQVRLQQYMSQELPYIQAGFRKGRGTRDQISNIRWILGKQENPRKTSTSLIMLKPFHKKLCKVVQDVGIPDHLNCLLGYPYAGQEATVRTGHGTVD